MTDAVLNVLKTYNIKATFFVCGNVWTTLTSDPLAQAALKRIISDGHDIGSHTYTHPHLDTITAAQIDAQFTTNLAAAQSVLGSAFSFSKYRAPFGFPFQTNNPNVAYVSAAAAKYGVHVGWGIDTDDWKCAQDGKASDCILTNLKAQIEAGHSGPILMHRVYKLTADTLPDFIALLQQNNYTFATAEQMVVDKYKVPSQQVMKQNAAANFTSAQISSFAVSECAKNQVISVVY